MILCTAAVIGLVGFGVGYAEEEKKAEDEAAERVELIAGAGATFPMPVYSKWAAAYERKTKNFKLDYQAIGSGGGISHIKAKTVDFGASDKPLSRQELDKEGLIQFPLIMGGVVPVVNIEGIESGELKLTAELLADVLLGNIRKWNDDKLATANPGLDLPNKEIVVVHRADGSGTTWIFTTYLSNVSPEWKKKVGADKAVSWPRGVGAKGNPGVAAMVKRADASIGYVEYTYAASNKLASVRLQNKEGRFVQPSIVSFQFAAENAKWDKDNGFKTDLTNQPGENTWPILGVSYILVHKKQENAAKARAMLKFFDWCLNHGDPVAIGLDYVPIPMKAVKMVDSLWKETVKADGKQIWKAEDKSAAKKVKSAAKGTSSK